MSAHASGALNGSTSSSPFFATQNSSLFVTGVGNSNGASGASNGSTSASPFFANQSSKPFGFGTVQYPAGSNTSPFVQSSSSYPRFGGDLLNIDHLISPFPKPSYNASTFGQTTSSFGGFGEATSTTPLFGHPGPSYNTFRGASFTTPVSTLQPSSFPLGGGGPTTADNSCGGTRAPYRPTPAEENLRHVVSISAMNCYCNKSHEELRSEEYKQTRNGGPSSAAHVPGVSNPLPNPFSVSSRNPLKPVTWCPPLRESPAFTFNQSSENPIQRTAVTSPFNRMSAHASGASNRSTSSSPFFAIQNSSLFVTGVGNSNGASGASNGSTSASPFFANQSSKPFGFGTAPSTTFAFRERSPSSTGFGFGYPTGTNTSPFVQSSSSFPGFGGANSTSPFAQPSRSFTGFGGATTSPYGQAPSSFGGFGEAAKTSPFGQTPSNFGGFGEATISTTPLFGDTTSSFSTFRGEPLFRVPQPSSSCGAASCTRPTITRRPSNPFALGGDGPAIIDNSREGTCCAPYRPSPADENNLSWNNASPVLTSISAMNCYCNKNHEELRSEDYKQIRNGGPSSAANVSGVSNPLPNPFSVSSTNPLQPANSSGWFPPSEPLAFAFKRSSENPFQRTGDSPAIADNLCGGTRAPYQPTPAEENNLSWNNASPVLTSISAMNCYLNKSHEELRSEDCKQIRNGGHSSAANVSGVSNPLPNPSQPANSSGWFPPCEPPPLTFNRSSENPIHRTDSSSSLGSDKNRTTLVQTSPVQTSVAQTRPSPTPTTTTTVSNQTLNANLDDLQLSITTSGGLSFIPSFVNCIIPAFGASGSNGVLLNSVLGTPVLGFPVLIPTTLAFIPQYPQVSDPTSALPLHQPETHSILRMILLNPTSSASTINPANAHLSTIAETTSHVSPSAGVLGEQITNLSISAPPAPTNAASSGSASPSDFNLPVTQHSSSIPKGLEIIVEHLGFNPWEGKSHLQDSQGGEILLCEDASDDADILSLAEFAVEQHNAMEQFRDQPDGKVELLKVTAACLEAVDGGRYHIVLEAKEAASSGIRVYAVVLLKKTNRPTPLIVLERWLHCLPSYSSDCSREMVPFRARLI